MISNLMNLPAVLLDVESTPNLNPWDELLMVDDVPKLKPELDWPVVEGSVEETPNLKPPPGAIVPSRFEVVLESFLTARPGFGSSQHTHFSLSASFATIQTLHDIT